MSRKREKAYESDDEIDEDEELNEEEVADEEGGDDDDDEEEDNDDDEVERKDGKRRRKKRRTGASLLIDEEAEEDDEADDEDEDDEDGGVRGLIADGSDEEGGIDLRSARREALRIERLRREQDRGEEDPQDLVRRFEEKYAVRDHDVDEEDGDTGIPLDAGGVDQQSLQPTIRDPRLFILRCRKPGYERRAILSLLQKMFDLKSRGVDIGILSAVAPEHLRGLLYVEAYSSSQVEQAIRGSDLISAPNGIKPVALEEMTDVLQVGRKLDKQKKGNWVRITRGMYKGDLAQVYSVPEGGADGQIMIRLIPRLKYRREGEEDSEEDDSDDDDNDVQYDDDPSTVLGKGKGKIKRRPPQKLFDPREVSRLSGQDEMVMSQRDRYTGEVFDGWNNELYRHGLLYKRVSIKTLLINDTVQPTVEELEKWIAAEKRIRLLPEEMPDIVDASEVAEGLCLDTAAMAGRRKVSLFKGDSVRVIRGEQTGLTGTIVGFDGSVVLIQSDEWGSEPFRTPRVDVVKSFTVGDHVKVSSGKRVGHSGVIVAVEGEMITLFTDSTREEIRVTSANVADSSDLAADDLSVAGVNGKQYKLFDLINPRHDRDAKAIIVGVQGDTVSALDGHNIVHEYPVSSIRNVPKDAFTHALDSRGNKLSRNIALHVTSGPLKDRTGVIVEVAGSTVFFKGSDEVKNCGILAVNSQDCEAQAAAARTITSVGRGIKSSEFKVPAPVPKGALASLAGGHAGSRPSNGRGGGAGFKGRDSLYGRDVKVTKGPYKGHLGKVIDTTEKTVRVELQTKMKIVTLTRDKVRDLEGNSDADGGFGGNARGTGGFSSFGSSNRPPGPNGIPSARTPYGAGGARTPYGARTPSYGGRTPAHSAFGGFGNRTPSQGGIGMRTPAHAGAFGSGGLTPRLGTGGFGSGGGPRTPGHDAFRPATPARADDYGGFGSLRQTPGRTPMGARMNGMSDRIGGIGNANPYSSYGVGFPNTPGTPAALPVTPAGGGLGGHSMEPMTPVDPSLLPQTPVDPSYMPQTPQIDPQTPVMLGQGEPQTPAPFVEASTPGPTGVPQTPRTPEPPTPLPESSALGDEPGTPAPGSEVDSAAQVGYRVLIDVIVSVPDMGTRSAVVLDAAVNGEFVKVRMLDDGTVHQLSGSQFTAVQPRVEDGTDSMVKVLDGPLGGRVGKLLTIDTSAGDDSPQGTIDFGRGDIQVLDMVFVAKYQGAYS